jgi:hypothetical protein
MTKEDLEAVFDRVRAWPPEKQEMALAALRLIEFRQGDIYELSDEERADLEEAVAEMERGEVASQEEVDAVFRRRG